MPWQLIPWDVKFVSYDFSINDPAFKAVSDMIAYQAARVRGPGQLLDAQMCWGLATGPEVAIARLNQVQFDQKLHAMCAGELARLLPAFICKVSARSPCTYGSPVVHTIPMNPLCR